jgi:transcription elongation factor GreA
MKTIQFTQDGYDALKKEFDELSSSKRQHAVDRLQKARAMGDLSENSEYTAAKEELAFIEGRILELEELLKNAQIVEQKTNSGMVVIGSHVTVERDGKHEEYTIVGEFEADPMQRKLSTTSPIGQALFGKKVGNTVEVEVPMGKMVYKIIDVKTN